MAQELKFCLHTESSGSYTMGTKTKKNFITAKGFGSQGVCRITGEEGQNSDFVDYRYDPQTGKLNVTATGFDMAHGVRPQGTFSSQPMSAGQALIFANAMDAALTAAIKHDFPGAASLNDLHPPQDASLSPNSNMLKSLLDNAAAVAKKALGLSGPEPTIREVLEQAGVTVSGPLTYKDVHKNPRLEYLEGFSKLSSTNEGTPILYISKKGDKIWDPRLDDGYGDWLGGRDKRHTQKEVFTLAKQEFGLSVSGANLAAQEAAKAMVAEVTDSNRGIISCEERAQHLIGKDTVAVTEKFDAQRPSVQATKPGSPFQTKVGLSKLAY